MNRAAQEKLVDNTVGNIKDLPKVGFKLLVRTDNLKIVGLVTARIQLYDKNIGDTRDVAQGIPIDGKGDMTNPKNWFTEYLDWFNPKTNELESCILPGPGDIILTMRNNSSLDDDAKNFTWLSFQGSAYVRDLQDRIGLLELQAEDIINSRENMKKERDAIKRHADVVSINRKGFEKTVKTLHRENINLKNQLDAFERAMPGYIEEKLKEKAIGDRKVKDAKKLGDFEGKGEIDKAKENLQKFRELDDLRSELEKQGKSGLDEIGKKLDVNSEAIITLAESVKDIQGRLTRADELTEVKATP